jgi:predicted amidohydrolase YtcJ
VNKGSEHQSHWAPGTSKGPDTYFPPPVLKRLLLELARAGIDPHIHVDGDGAVREALDAIAYLRTTAAGKRARPALAHDEIVDPADFPRFAKLNTTAVLSLQWGKPAADTVGMLKPYMGPKRYELVEP